MEDLSGIDALPGGLTWVLRPNGQWWPGLVLALDELSAGCRQPSRKGRMMTPIQLLGKEDWSTDWYNLEKSTRVKAFRCGEFDEFIERAEASVTDSHKKRSAKGKNVSRNDAVLHALRLEKLCFSDRNKKTSNGSMNSILKPKSNVQAHSKRSHELPLVGNPSFMESNTTGDLYNASPLSNNVSCPIVSRKLQSCIGEQHSGQADLSPQLHEALAEIYSTTSTTQVDHGKRNLSLIGNVASESSFVVETESSTFDRKIGVTKGQSVSEVVGDIPVVIHSSNPFSNGIDVFVSPPLLGRTSSSLYDVKLNVNASYYGPHTTLVSFVSKSSGQDITGFPIPVEVVENGFVNVDNLVDVSPSSERKHSRGKKSGLLPKKIRKISLITGDAKERKPVVKMNRDPSISCVPMSVLFCRLNEALRG